MGSLLPLYLSREFLKKLKIGDFPNKFLAIGFNPSSLHYLKKNSINNEDTFNYFANEGHEYVSKRTNEVVSSFEEFLFQNASNEFTETYTNFLLFNFKFFYSFLLSNLFIINQAQQKNNFDSIYSFRNLEDLSSLSFPENKISLFYDLLSKYCESNGIAKIDIKLSKNKKVHNIKKTISPFLNAFYFYLAKHKIKNLQNYIVIPDDSYNMANLKERFLKIDPRLKFINLRHKQGNFKDKLLSLIEKSTIYLPIESKKPSQEKNVFRETLDILKIKFEDFLDKELNLELLHFGVDLKPLAKSFIASFFEKELITLNDHSRNMNELLDSINIIMTVAQHSLGLNGLLGEYSSKNNIQGMLISHGSHVIHDDPIAKVEWEHHAKNLIEGAFPRTAIQTCITQKFTNKYKNKSTIYCNTGPLLFRKNNHLVTKENLKRNIFNLSSKVLLITHVGTPKPFETFRPWVYETIDEYIYNINLISEYLEDKKDIFLGIRFRENMWLSAEEFSSRVRISSNSFIVDKNVSLFDNLKSSDFIISYSSTAIEEALELEVPVATFDPQKKYNHLNSAHENLNPHIYAHLTKINELDSVLSNFLRPNRAFDSFKEGFEVDYDIDQIVSGILPRI